MDQTQYRIQSFSVLSLISIGYGFYSRWDGTAVTLTVVFGTLLIVESLGMCIRNGSRKNIQQMSPSELESYIDDLSPRKRQQFVAHLLSVGSTDDAYLNKLNPEQRNKFDALLNKLRSEPQTDS